MQNKNVMRKVLAKLKLYGVNTESLKFIKNYLKENDINIDCDKIIKEDGVIICGNKNLLCIIECNPLVELGSNNMNVNIIILNGSNIIKIVTDYFEKNLKLYHITPQYSNVFEFYNGIGFISKYPKEVSDELYKHFSKDFNLLNIDDYCIESSDILFCFDVNKGYENAKNAYEKQNNKEDNIDITYIDDDGIIHKL